MACWTGRRFHLRRRLRSVRVYGGKWKDYGFNIMFTEHESTIPTLWDTTKKFMKENPQLIHPRNVMKKLFEGEDGGYNLCHFWSNFEIASLKFLRSDEYMKYFPDYLDQAGGFFYERWGDAPVHSLAVGMFCQRNGSTFSRISVITTLRSVIVRLMRRQRIELSMRPSKNVDNHCMNNYYKLQKSSSKGPNCRITVTQKHGNKGTNWTLPIYTHNIIIYK